MMAGDEDMASTDAELLREACLLARACPRSGTAYSVGALIVTAEGALLAAGFSRESGASEHAEEAALAKVDPDDPQLAGATIYTSLEPCDARASRPQGCADLILQSQLRRVVFALREPPLLAPGAGADKIRAGGRDVVHLESLAGLAREPNTHLLP
jgi:pyrimidine deaminase RibD-like protein